MASGKAQYLENVLLNYELGRTAYAPPATFYLALYTVAPTATTAGTEVVGPSYTRAAVPNDTSHFAAASAGSKTTNADIVFGTANEDWGSIVATAFMDASTGGNMHYFGTVTVTKTILAGEVLKFLAGEITITES